MAVSSSSSPSCSAEATTTTPRRCRSDGGPPSWSSSTEQRTALMGVVLLLALPLVGWISVVLVPSSITLRSTAAAAAAAATSTGPNNNDAAHGMASHNYRRPLLADDGQKDDDAAAASTNLQLPLLLLQDGPVIFPNATLLAAASSSSSSETPFGVVDRSRRHRLRHHYHHHHRNLANGVRTVLVVRVLAADRTPTTSQSTLQQYIFTHTNSLANQMNRCSAGALQLTPAPYGNGGVIDVPVSARSTDLAGLISQSQLVAPQYLPGIGAGGNLYNVAQHIMFVLPAQNGYVAEAEIGGKYSWFNDVLATSISVIMHEVGHNFGLDHAGILTDEYGDYSANMGRSVSTQETPLMCFNAANNWKLGWYPNGRRDLSSVPTSSTRVTIAAFVNYPTNHPVLVKLGGNTYVQYNEATRHNVGTRANANQVVIVRQENNAYTTLLAGLSAGQMYQGSGFVVQVCSLSGGLADLSIGQSSVNCNGVGSSSGSSSSNGAFVPQPGPVVMTAPTSWFQPAAPAPAPFFRFTPSPPTAPFFRFTPSTPSTSTAFRSTTTPSSSPWFRAWASLFFGEDFWGQSTTTITTLPSDTTTTFAAAAVVRDNDRRARP